jgi:hypothetical protein
MEKALDQDYVWVGVLAARDRVVSDFGREQAYGVGGLSEARCLYLDEEYTHFSFEEMMHHAGNRFYWVRFLMDIPTLEIRGKGADAAVIIAEESGNEVCLRLLQEVEE